MTCQSLGVPVLPPVRPYAGPVPDLDALARDLDAVRKSVDPIKGPADLSHLRLLSALSWLLVFTVFYPRW